MTALADLIIVDGTAPALASSSRRFRVSVQVASGPVGGPAAYLQWGWAQISVPNLVVMLLTIAVFVLALVLPFPHDGDESDGVQGPRGDI